MTKEHKPTPWYVETGSYGDVWIVGDKENWVPRICHIPDYSEANAAHIVKCVNMHDELVEALKDISRITKGDIGFDSKASAVARLNHVIGLSSSTLKKAGAL